VVYISFVFNENPSSTQYLHLHPLVNLTKSLAKFSISLSFYFQLFIKIRLVYEKLYITRIQILSTPKTFHSPVLSFKIKHFEKNPILHLEKLRYFDLTNNWDKLFSWIKNANKPTRLSLVKLIIVTNQFHNLSAYVFPTKGMRLLYL